jgi:Asp-tRNA(Asn)/Glu-tRNA(Gln) amidotransferase A subunit family amidase
VPDVGAARTMASSPHELTASDAVACIRSGELSPSELLLACLAQIERSDGDIHAWTHLDRSAATQAATEIDRKIGAGEAVGNLAGVPVGVKDIFNLNGMPCEMGSPIWAGFTPGNDARVVHYLRMSDAIFPGKTVTAEFAVHAPGPTENPHRRGHIPGTSSSGSAAAVAAYMVPVALGTQTAGSIIRPASYCGVYGFKPSFGAVPRTGMLKTTDTLDTVGWFARCVEDLQLLFETVRVKGRDFPILEAALQDERRQTRPPGRPWRVGLVRGPKWDAAPQTTRDAVEAFAARIAELPDFVVEPAPCPEGLAEAHTIHQTIYDRALAYYFKEEFRRHTLVSDQIYEIIGRGNLLTVEDYSAALQRQTQLAAQMDRLFVDGYDVLMDMATAGEAMEGLDSVDRPDHALIWTLCWLPTVSVPVLRGPTGLPLGLQFIARRYNDRLLLAFLRSLAEHGLLPARTFPEPALGTAPAAQPRSS